MNNNQITGLNRDITDKYYTNVSTVNLCYEYIKNNLKINKNDLVIEPSAGDGAFISIIKQLTNKYIFIDIEPNNKEIIKEDYLELDISKYKYKNIHIIGNPPFGRQSSMAIKFIKKSVDFATSISFILPKSFKKDSLQKYFPLNYHLKLSIDLPKNSFLVNNKEYDVPCVFQIWKKENVLRQNNIILQPNNFEFVNKKENPDISFRRVGVYAGKIDKNTKDKSEQSHYFIKFKNNSLDDNLNKLAKINFETDNTVGPKSISKQEIIKKFNELLI